LIGKTKKSLLYKDFNIDDSKITYEIFWKCIGRILLNILITTFLEGENFKESFTKVLGHFYELGAGIVNAVKYLEMKIQHHLLSP
jgi:starvation-inducible outer membrane lipoprotein